MKELKRFTQQQIEFTGGESDRDPDIVSQIREHARVMYGGPWRYNEIIGYIRLHFLGSQIRGEYFGPEVKRITKTRKRVLWRKTHKLAPEVSLPSNPSNREIFDGILRYIQSCEQELPKRFVDASQLKTLAPFVNWKRLYESNA